MQSENLKGLAVLAVDPGGLLDSRALTGPDIPRVWTMQVYVANLLQPLLRYLNPTFRRSADAAKDVIDLAVSPEYVGQDGYFIMNKKATSSLASKDENMQAALWRKSLEWSAISQSDTVLPL